MTSTQRARAAGPIAAVLLALASPVGPALARQEPEGDKPSRETAELADGRWITGRLADRGGAIVFLPDADGPPLSLDRIARIVMEPMAPLLEPAPMLLELGFDEQVSGRLVAIDAEAIRLEPSGGIGAIRVDRRGALALRQRPGMAIVADETIGPPDPSRWTFEGGAALGDSGPDHPGVVRLEGERAKARYRLPEAVESGLLELSFRWEEARVAGRRWWLELRFDGAAGVETVRVVLGMADPFPSIESSGGPDLVVQPLVLEPGWHRLSARFEADRTLLAIDGDVLGRGDGVSGPLSGVALVAEGTANADRAGASVALIDALKIVRTFEPTTATEVDPSQDEIRLAAGDQIWGIVLGADRDRIRLEVLERPIELPWSRVAGVAFRRTPEAGAMVEGPLVRVSWQGGAPEMAPERLEGALAGIDAEVVRIATAYAGVVAVPRSRITEIAIQGRGLRLVLDPHRRHLGDQLMPELDPPLPDGDHHHVAFRLVAVPEGPAALVLDAEQVESALEGRFADDIERGDLRTNVVLNDEPVDFLNRFVADVSGAPIRLRVPIPEGLLREGENVLDFEQTGMAEDPGNRDDLGLLRVALEWPIPGADAP